ncbi:potassium/sodium hyperpolarization-activated cyclic nucleotide-gated channel 4-like [Ananas comosus]|uniref:Potassium/sodium hyperpolarization-activated cyclic nucleotide-gated channel 4-like n=1 Tax=Ananas comosus TaxID=4615 RepID=A0A6P5EJ82_ANACO|nr:potassium/sodium hyperpolarization-activated cyclic nucleotide-gated channel 4-like [Ananas comosus]
MNQNGSYVVSVVLIALASRVFHETLTLNLAPANLAALPPFSSYAAPLPAAADPTPASSHRHSHHLPPSSLSISLNPPLSLGLDAGRGYIASKHLADVAPCPGEPPRPTAAAPWGSAAAAGANPAAAPGLLGPSRPGSSNPTPQPPLSTPAASIMAYGTPSPGRKGRCRCHVPWALPPKAGDRAKLGAVAPELRATAAVARRLLLSVRPLGPRRRRPWAPPTAAGYSCTAETQAQQYGLGMFQLRRRCLPSPAGASAGLPWPAVPVHRRLPRRRSTLSTEMSLSSPRVVRLGHHRPPPPPPPVVVRCKPWSPHTGCTLLCQRVRRPASRALPCSDKLS